MEPILPKDTTIEAARVYGAALRNMGHERRVMRLRNLCAAQRRFMEAGVRHRHPDYTDRQVKMAAIRLTLGDSLFRAAYPGVEVEP